MKGSDRLIRKTQPDMRFMPKRLCSYQQASSESEAVGIADPETFDDSEFYQQLLKEFLEASSIVGSAVPASTKKRVKPPRDRKGSKGRRLRYDVQVCFHHSPELLLCGTSSSEILDEAPFWCFCMPFPNSIACKYVKVSK